MVHFVYARSHSRKAEVEDQEEQVRELLVFHKRQVLRSGNISFEQDKARCIPPIILGLSFNHYLHIKIA
jgi:hypothetical protein